MSTHEPYGRFKKIDSPLGQTVRTYIEEFEKGCSNSDNPEGCFECTQAFVSAMGHLWVLLDVYRLVEKQQARS